MVARPDVGPQCPPVDLRRRRQRTHTALRSGKPERCRRSDTPPGDARTIHPEGHEPTESYVSSSSVLPYKRLRAQRLDDAGSRPVNLHPRPYTKGRHQSTRTNEEREISPHPSMTASVMPTTRVTSSTHVTSIRRTVPATATTHARAPATTARRTNPQAPS
jgi:hypothetical protein